MRFIYDPGHAWLEVTTKQAAAVGLSMSSFSEYSYINGNRLYLEEDCDAVVFIKAYEKKHGSMPEFTEVHQDPTPIRNYRRLPA